VTDRLAAFPRPVVSSLVVAPFETNRSVARAFIKMAQLLERQGENPYRARAYRRGAGAVWSCREPIERLAALGRLETLSGIGEDLAAKIHEILDTGTFAGYESQLRQSAPAVQALIHDGLTPDLALLVDAYQRRGAIDELRGLAASHLLRSLPGVTRDAEHQLLAWIAGHEDRQEPGDRPHLAADRQQG
jgi:DNA polymerase (family 10)